MNSNSEQATLGKIVGGCVTAVTILAGGGAQWLSRRTISPKKIVLKPSFFIKTGQNRVFEVQFGNCWVILMTKNFHTRKMKKMLLKKEQKYGKNENVNFLKFLSADVKIEFKIAKNSSYWYFTYKNIKFKLFKNAPKIDIVAPKNCFFSISFKTYATVRFGSSAVLIWCLKYIFGMTKKRFSHGKGQANS